MSLRWAWMQCCHGDQVGRGLRGQAGVEEEGVLEVHSGICTEMKRKQKRHMVKKTMHNGTDRFVLMTV